MSQGYLLFAVDNKETNYNKLAEQCALSIKRTQPEGYNAVAIVTNNVSKVNKSLFDFVIDYSGPAGMDSRSRAYDYTPFDETVLLDSDMLFLRPLDQIWDAMKKQDIYITCSPQNWKGEKFQYGKYREVFEKNFWPDVYNAWTYFKKSHTAKEFFDLVKIITDNPTPFINEFLPNTLYETMPTDEAFALALSILDINLPVWDFPRIVHMKPQTSDQFMDWTEKMRFSFNELGQVKVGVHQQAELFHYIKKDIF